MKNLILLSFVLSQTVYSQTPAPTVDELNQHNKQDLETIKKLNEETKEDARVLKLEQLRLEALTILETQRESIKQSTLTEVKHKLEGMSFSERNFSKKAGFYKCIRGYLKDYEYANVSHCKADHDLKLTPEEEKQITAWDIRIGVSPQDMVRVKKNLTSNVSYLTSKIKHHPSTIDTLEMSIKQRNNRIFLIGENAKEEKLLSANTQYTNCNAGTPEINLEAKKPYPGAKFPGPFLNVPRDNQDGIGSCFANVSKNLLVGLSGGANVASFLDMALQYRKKVKNGLEDEGLDGGGSCATLEEVAVVGYCPQKFSPGEIGDQNPVGGIFATGGSTVRAQSRVVDILSAFLKSKNNFTQGKAPLDDSLLLQGKAIISKIKANPNIKLPLPGARFEIPEKFLLKTTYDHLPEAKKTGVTLEAFQEEHASHYKNFYPKYVQMLQSGAKLDSIFQTYADTLKPFITKYGLEGELAEYKRIFKTNIANDYNDPNFKKSLRESFDFLKDVTGKTSLSDADFLKSCLDENSSELSFLSDLQRVVNSLQNEKIDPSLLYDKNGEFHESVEVMQLAVAPACLNPANRKKPSTEFVCDQGYTFINTLKASAKTEDEKILEMRKKVVASLLQGQALGNTFQRHINTIVGMRFNKAAGKCEYAIRESQNGTTTWQSEKNLFSKIEALTEVRKK